MTGHGTHVQLGDGWEDSGWFRFPREFARDKTLSWKAKGIAALLASHKATFQFSATELERWAKDGRDGTAAGLKELETAGYLVRDRQSSGQMVYRLFPEPHTENPVEAGQGIHPENPVPGNPSTENPGDYKESSPKDNSGEGEQVDISLDLDLPPANADGEASTTDAERKTFPAHLFAEFWKVYPRKVGKDGAQRKWETVVRRVAREEHGGDYVEAARVIWKGAARYKRERDGQDKAFTKHAQTWLNKGCWADEDPSAPASIGGGRGHVPYRDEDVWGQQSG